MAPVSLDWSRFRTAFGYLLALLLVSACERLEPVQEAAPPQAPIEASLAGGALVTFDRWDALALWLDTREVGPVSIYLGPGEFDATRSLRLPSNSRLEGAGDGVTRIVARREMNVLVANREVEAGDSFITVENLTVDCARRVRDGIFQRRVSGLRLAALTVTGCERTGVRVSGHGEITRGAVLDAISAIDNSGDGIMIMWATRNARYSNLYAAHNGGIGIVIDHSEGTASNLIADQNGGSGIFLRNLFSVAASNLSATRNGEHGILAQGFVASTGSAWTALGNSGTQFGAFDEIHFSGASDLSYGVTDSSVIEGLVAGAYAHGTGAPSARHGLYVAPEISGLVRGGSAFLDVMEAPLSAPQAQDGQ